MSNPATLLTQDDQKRIAEAVKAAESRTSGEIVPYIVGRSDPYPEAPWRAGTLVSLLVLGVLAGLWMGTNLWLPYGVAEVALLTIAGFILGAGLTLLFPSLKLLFVSSAVVKQRVDERAGLAFLDEEVFATRDRTGILIFLSLLEHRVRILGDSGINAKVKQEEWDGIVADMVAGMKRGAPGEALVGAIGRCGELLARMGVEIRPDDTNELDNAVRLHTK
ncbi:MAG: hypothetical protein HY962_02820 [Ignavibacteriae bacterium]|nr:hypothetical protein [Ignavibacteriota bacterium]